MTKYKIFLLLFLFFPIFAFSQRSYSTTSQKAIGYYETASSFYDEGNDSQAITYFKKAIDVDSTFYEAYFYLSRVYSENENINAIIDLYKKCARINGSKYPEVYYYLSSSYYISGLYKEALAAMKTYSAYPNIDKKLKKNVDFIIERSAFAIEAMNNPVPFEPINMGPNVNSQYDEYLPAITADEQILIITGRIPKTEYTPGTKSTQEDFFISQKIGEKWGKARNMREVNTPLNEGAQSISADGKYLFFTACGRQDGMGACDIYYSVKNGNEWSLPINLDYPINTASWESQPSISSDGKTLYFASDRPNGIGKVDIWKTTIIGTSPETGNLLFSEPKNLGNIINTPDVEGSPFIHQDNQTLYFSSEGLIGMGGLDLFVSRQDADGKWSKPKNLGYPINSALDETSLIVNAKGDKAYFSSDRAGGYGLIDLYEFDLYKDARPTQVTYVKGQVFDAQTQAKLEASLELIDLETAQVVATVKSDKTNGEFLICLPVNKNYALNVSKKDYLFYSDNFSLKNLANPSKPYQLDVPLNPIRVGETVVLRNIFFATDSYELKPESKAELAKLIAFMNDNPKVKIEIGGHTDDVGADDYNLKLSENRAKSVLDYLVKNNIPEKRLTFKGYGETEPIAENSNDENRQLNRRTEFKITK